MLNITAVSEQLNGVNLPVAKVTVDIDDIAETAETKTVDDLTTINGIGPTFAKRLQAAGIHTFQNLAAASPDYVKEAAKLADWQANPADWIAAAQDLV